MADENVDALSQLGASTKRLEILQVRAAIQGINCPPEVLIEIEQIQEIINRLSVQVETPHMQNFAMPGMTPLRYYVYVSDAKIDMLYAQIYKDVKDFASQETRYERLNAVVDFIQNNADYGTVDEPESYFFGRLDMICQEYTESPEFVYFTGMSEKTIVGLGGSKKHLLGITYRSYKTAPGSEKYGSNAISIRLALEKQVQARLGSRKGKTVTGILNLITGKKFLDDLDVLESIAICARETSGSHQRLEFMAKRLIDGPLSDRFKNDQTQTQVLLGTPIYVALS